MIAMMNFAALTVVTIFAAVVAVGFNSLMLRAAFVLMRPARRMPARTELARGTAELAQ